MCVACANFHLFIRCVLFYLSIMSDEVDKEQEEQAALKKFRQAREDAGIDVPSDFEKRKQQLIEDGVSKDVVDKLREPDEHEKDMLRALAMGLVEWEELYGGHFTNLSFSNILIEHPDTGEAIDSFSRITCTYSISFYNCIFFEGVDCAYTCFEERVVFHGCHFFKIVWFGDATFCQGVSFNTCTFDGGVHFTDAVFKGKLFFFDLDVHGSVYFLHTIFEEEFNARSVVYRGSVHYTGAMIKKVALFEGTIFYQEVNFDAAQFEGTALFHDTKYKALPSFAACSFKQTPSSEHLDGVKDLLLGTSNGSDVQDTDKKHEIWKTDKKSPDKLRYLRQLCSDANDHEREAFYFAYEMKAHRYHRVHPSMRWLYWLYEFVSDYGRSVWRPFIGFMSVWFLGWMLVAVNGLKTTCEKPITYIEIWPFYLGNMLPFLGASYHARTSLKCSDGTDVILNSFGYFVNFSGSILAVIFIFLIGLALRNRFRL